MTQNGTGNRTTTSQQDGSAGTRYIRVNQDGVSNTVDATQAGGSVNGQIFVDQKGVDGNTATKNSATATQGSGSTSSFIQITQGGFADGGNNSGTATVFQGQGNDNQARVNQTATLATTTVNQVGNGNRATTDQTQGSGSAQYSSIIVNQQSDNNQTYALQTTGRTTADIFQGGGGSHVVESYQTQGTANLTVQQTGVSNRAYNLQSTGGGNGRDATIVQRGERGYVQNVQGGSVNTFFGIQDAGSVQSQIYNTQSGNGVFADTFQGSGTNNLIVNTQNGTGGNARLYQYGGDGNTIYNTQSGTNDISLITQFGNTNYVQLVQGGLGAAGNNAEIVQSGNNNTVNGMQMQNGPGGQNVMTMSQNGSFNTTSFSQTGSGNVATVRQ
ncbi:hypothetical protein ASF49_14405 [Methylobacterium sp. Leaf104]|nr:hypothetical protein ASF49_14405 [Methylobacterium sp. Leaf104]